MPAANKPAKPVPTKLLAWERAIDAGQVTRADAVKVLAKHEPKLAQQLADRGNG